MQCERNRYIKLDLRNPTTVYKHLKFAEWGRDSTVPALSGKRDKLDDCVAIPFLEAAGDNCALP